MNIQNVSEGGGITDLHSPKLILRLGLEVLPEIVRAEGLRGTEHVVVEAPDGLLARRSH